MSEEEKEAIKILKSHKNPFDLANRTQYGKALQAVLSLIEKQQKKIDKLENQAKMSAEEHTKAFDRMDKMIELLIQDLQLEGCLINMTEEEIYRYYEKRTELLEE